MRVRPGITLRKSSEAHVDHARSILHTDKLPSYKLVGKQFIAHERVDHKEGEYARGRRLDQQGPAPTTLQASFDVLDWSGARTG